MHVYIYCIQKGGGRRYIRRGVHAHIDWHVVWDIALATAASFCEPDSWFAPVLVVEVECPCTESNELNVGFAGDLVRFISRKRTLKVLCASKYNDFEFPMAVNCSCRAPLKVP